MSLFFRNLKNTAANFDKYLKPETNSWFAKSIHSIQEAWLSAKSR